MSRRDNTRECRVVLVGMMGSGKTTVGRLLSDATGWQRVDNDALLDQLYGKTPKQILDLSGEKEMRAAEDAALALAIQTEPPAIVDAAAGAITSEQSRRRLARSVVVWLRARPETLYRRASGGDHRPWLDRGEDWFLTTAREREPLYQSVADVIIDTDDRPPREIADEIASRLDALCSGRAVARRGDSTDD